MRSTALLLLLAAPAFAADIPKRLDEVQSDYLRCLGKAAKETSGLDPDARQAVLLRKGQDCATFRLDGFRLVLGDAKLAEREASKRDLK